MDNRGSSEDDKRELRECGRVGSFCGSIQEGGEKAYHGVRERGSAENRRHSCSSVFVLICASQLEREAVMRLFKLRYNSEDFLPPTISRAPLFVEFPQSSTSLAPLRTTLTSSLTSHISIGYESNADIEPEPEIFLSLWLKAAW